MKKEINTDRAPAAIGPYSQAVRSGNLLFISGQISINPATGALIKDNIAKETVQVLENLKGILESDGLNLGNIIKTTVFLKNMNDFSAFNEVYSEYFKKSFPARACIAVSELPKGVSVEIDAIASYDEL